MAPKVEHSKQASKDSTSVEDLFALLNNHIEQSEYEDATRVSDQILTILPGDEDALRCKIVSLIKNDNTEEALSVVNSSRNVPLDLSYYEAYCLYRQYKLDEALEILKVGEADHATMLLEAQILYRSGKMDDCLDIYRKLQHSKIESLEINTVACLTSSGRASEVEGLLESLKLKATRSSDLAYNAACALIQTGKLTEAEQLLLSARRIGQEELMDDNLSDDTMDKELARISVQLACIHQLLGRRDEALDSYSNLLSRSLGDDSSLAVALNNTIELKGLREISESVKRLEQLFEKSDGGKRIEFSGELEQKLSRDEKAAICANLVLLLLHAKRLDRVRELVPGIRDMFPGSEIPVLVEAAVLVREDKSEGAEEILSRFAERFPEKSKPVLLARAQVAANAGHAEVAFDSLEKIPEIHNMPATVATMVALKERVGCPDDAESVLDSAVEWWSDSMTENLDVVVREAASFKLKRGKDGDAARLYEDLFNRRGSVEALARLVMTSAGISIDKAEAYEKRLEKIPGLDGINVDLLERTSGEGNRKTGKGEKRKKRKRKPRYPKGFDPANPGPPPDPERWLPKRERSSYRPKRKDRRGGQVRGSQGAVVREKCDDVAGDTRLNKASSSKGEQPKSIKSSKKKSRK